MNIKSRLDASQTERVTSVLQQFIDSWNAKDLDEFGRLFTQEAEFTDVVGQTAIGREAIIKQHVFPFERVMKLATFEMNDAYIRRLSSHLILVSAVWKVSGSITPDGKPLPDRNGVLQLVLEETNDQFRIQLVHNSDNALPYEKQEKFIRT